MSESARFADAAGQIDWWGSSALHRHRYAIMKMRALYCLFFLCNFCIATAHSAETYSKPTETRLAERLGEMGYRVELVLADTKIWVDSVYASGRITDDGMNSEPLPEEMFACMKGLQRLRKLRLDVKGGQDDRSRLKALAGLHTLRELELFGKDVTDDVMPFVSSLTNLQSLRLWDAPISDRGLGRLSELKALKRIDLGSLRTINRACIEALTKLNQLEEVRIYAQVEQGALSLLSAVPRLETVAVGGSEVNRMLAELKNIPTVQTIRLSQAEVDDVAAGQLRAMKNLKALELECCTFTPEAVQILKSLKLRRIECIRIESDVISEFAKGMSEFVGNLELAK